MMICPPRGTGKVQKRRHQFWLETHDLPQFPAFDVFQEMALRFAVDLHWDSPLT
jgi:hypothetical protein